MEFFLARKSTGWAVVLLAVLVGWSPWPIGQNLNGGPQAGLEPTVAPGAAGPTRAADFLMPIDDVFSQMGTGTIATGTIVRGSIAVGEEVHVIGDEGSRASIVTGIGSSGGDVESAAAGEQVGLVLRGLHVEDVSRGMVVASPGTIRARKAFRGRVAMLRDTLGKEGRFGSVMVHVHTAAREAFWFLPDSVETAPPGVDVDLFIDVETPVPLEEGMEFLLRLNGETVGEGTVKNVIF